MAKSGIRCPECGSENMDRIYDINGDKITILVKCLYCGRKWGGVLRPI